LGRNHIFFCRKVVGKEEKRHSGDDVLAAGRREDGGKRERGRKEREEYNRQRDTKLAKPGKSAGYRVGGKKTGEREGVRERGRGERNMSKAPGALEAGSRTGCFVFCLKVARAVAVSTTLRCTAS
jgi:hypothetical protein